MKKDGETISEIQTGGRAKGDTHVHHDDIDDPEKGRGCCGGICKGRCSCCPSGVIDKVKNASSHVKNMKLKKLTGVRANLLHVNSNGKVYKYDHEALLSWRSLPATTGTIFFNRQVWIVVPLVLSVAFVSAMLVYYGVPHARKLDTERFNMFVNYIKVFIAFMLGLFINNAFKRWWSSVTSFKRFLTSIKQLIYTLHAIGLRQDLIADIERTCIASCYILNEEVHCAQLVHKKDRTTKMSEKMKQLFDAGLLSAEERQELEKDHHGRTSQELGVRSSMIWIWIGELMNEVKAEPQIAPPMYVRLLFLCHDCMAQVEELKTNLTVQLPFTYAHMLAVLVHLSNVLMAISCGLSFGSALSELSSRQDEMAGLGSAPGSPQKRIIGEFYEAVQVLGMQIIILMLQPILYQAFLVIAHALCYPYGQDICSMPTETFIQNLHYELEVMCGCKNLDRGAPVEPRVSHKKKDEDSDEEGDDDDE